MFLTLKSELHSPMMFEMQDNSTFGELKNEVEQYLKIAKDLQKIASLKKDYEDKDVILESLIEEELNGGVLLLNVYNTYSMETDFYGFLHVYRKEDTAKEDFKNLEDNFDSLRKKKVPAFEKNTTIVIDSSQDSSSSSSATSSNDNNEDQSDALSDTSDENDSKKSRMFSDYRKSKEHHDKLLKRRTKELDGSQGKKFKNSLEHEYFYEYLDEDYETNAVQPIRSSQKSVQDTNKLPTSKEQEKVKVKENIFIDTNIHNNSLDKESPKRPIKSSSSFEVTSARKNYSTAERTPSYCLTEKEKVNLSIDTNTLNNSLDKDSLKHPMKSSSSFEVTSARKKYPNGEKAPPYSLINPEQRKYLLVITNDAEKITFRDYEDFIIKLIPFFSKENLAHIRFHPLFPAVIYEEKLWLACSNESSYQWSLETILQVFKGRFIGHNLATYWKMKTFAVNMVNVGQFNDWFAILKTMEIQNPGLHTDMWIVKKINHLKWSEKNYGNFTEPPNVVIHFLIDKQSAEFLKENDYVVLYALWTLKFNLIEEKP